MLVSFVRVWFTTRLRASDTVYIRSILRNGGPSSSKAFCAAPGMAAAWVRQAMIDTVHLAAWARISARGRSPWG